MADAAQIRDVQQRHEYAFNCGLAWSRERGIDDGVLRYRLRSGWSFERAITTPVDHVQTFEIDGEHLNVREIERRNGLGRGVLSRRVRAGMNISDALADALKTKVSP